MGEEGGLAPGVSTGEHTGQAVRLLCWGRGMGRTKGRRRPAPRRRHELVPDLAPLLAPYEELADVGIGLTLCVGELPQEAVMPEGRGPKEISG